MNEHELKRYCKKIRALLPCSRKQKQEIMAQLEANIRAYMAEHPETDIAQTMEHFGSPEAVAGAYVENAGTAEILRALQVRRRIVAAVVGILLAALLLWAVAVTVSLVALRQEGVGYNEVSFSEALEEAAIEDAITERNDK